jgi:predicted RNase H-related nuclease YkuK (DUF458 family)
MSKFKNAFKKFGGEWIPDIIEYLKDYVKENPGTTISVGCDSIQKRRRTVYACTIMMHNKDIRDGAHVVFFREKHEKIRDNQERLYKEIIYAYEIGEYLDKELEGHYIRQDIDELSRKKYKFHLQKSDGENAWVQGHHVEKYINGMVLSEYEKVKEYRLVDIHLDYNPKKYTINQKGRKQINISNEPYVNYVPWLKGLNFRVFCKPIGYGATSAADLLLQD